MLENSILILVLILALVVTNTQILKSKSKILGALPSKVLLFSLVAIYLTDVVSSKGVVVGTFEIGILLLIFLTFAFLLNLFQHFASERQIKGVEQVLDMDKGIIQKFKDRPAFMAVYALVLVVVVVSFWML